MKHAPYGQHSEDSSDAESSDEEESAEEDEEELLIGAGPDMYQQLRPWGRRDVLAAGGYIVA
eukprot:2604745-Prymnesium_polylepis.1